MKFFYLKLQFSIRFIQKKLSCSEGIFSASKYSLKIKNRQQQLQQFTTEDILLRTAEIVAIIMHMPMN